MPASKKTVGLKKRGSALLITVVMLGFASFIIGSILTTTMAYAWNAERTYNHDKALYLADAGLRASLIRLNAASDGNISFLESRDYISRTETFPHPGWGFEARVLLTNSIYQIISTGTYNGLQAVVQSDVTLGPGARSVHALYAHALFAGNNQGATNYILKIGGTGTGADFVKGDAYSGGAAELTGTANLRHPEILVDTNADGICEPGETWTNSYTTQMYTNPLSKTAFNTLKSSMNTNMNRTYGNGKYDYGEAFVDTIGDGIYQPGEPYTDGNGNGVRDAGDSYIDRNSNGVYNAGVDAVVDMGNGRYDAGEEWVEDASHSQRVNGKYDPAGGYYLYSGGSWSWKTSYKINKKTYSCSSWPAESYEDVGDGVYSTSGEAFTDQNGVYDAGEEYLDDRNDLYDYGTQAKGRITGMPAPGPGQRSAPGYDEPIDPPNLTNMFYGMPNSGTKPYGALSRWGYDVAVTSNDYGTAKAITDTTKPEHIFVRNPPTSGSTSSGGKTIYGRSYSYVTNSSGRRLDDYFLEDPADSTYNTYDTSKEIDGTVNTAPMFINVKANSNNKLYFVDGNLYLHNPQVYSMRFREPGTRITIVANGNITLSDEFYYNAAYASGLTRNDMNSTVVNNPSDVLCLIALKNPAFPDNTGNIFIGDSQFGTGGSIHALLYAENDFVDNNLNTADQSFISVFGNMTAGNQIRLNRTAESGQYRTRLDVTLDERVRNGDVIIPGLPHPVGTQRSLFIDTAWHLVPGTWNSFSGLQ
ncbi:MAG: hypothetical protein R6X19_06535 [Kiritimatiellia bacterium]